jgi:hypothetical protein
MSARRGQSARRMARWLVPEANPSGTAYGIIAIGALLAAESSVRETYPETVGSVALTMLLYWLAHSYSQLLGRRLSTHRRLSYREAWDVLLHDWSILRGASAPFVCLLIAWTAGASQANAVTAGLWSAVASLVVFELAAGLRSRARGAELAVDVLFGAAMALAIVALKALLH